MAFSVETVRSMLGKYKFRDLTVEELKNVHTAYPNFTFSMDTYTFKDGSLKHLLNCKGTVPTKYMGNFYNIPIRLWILDSHPFAPPLCFLMPTVNMGIRVGKHIDTEGRIYLPYLQNWSHPKSTIIGLIHEMIAKFDEELPMYSLSAVDVNKQFELLSYISQVTESVSDIEVNDKRRAASGGDQKDGAVNKVTVVGAGDLGMACVMAVLAKGFKDKTLLLDVSEGSLKGGGAMDLEMFNLPNVEVSRDFSAATDSRVVVLTVNAWTNAQSYISVIQSNVDMLRGIVPILAHACPHSVLIVASQPVDIMTYVVWKLSGFPKNQVIGIGCNLDSERFRYAIENVLKAHSWGKEAWIVGEHGEEKVHAWSNPAIARSQPDGADLASFQEQLANRAIEVLKGKGQRSWSVGLSVADLVDSILRNKMKPHSVSTLAKGYCDINSNVFLSLPCVLGTTGVLEVVGTALKDDVVIQKLQSSAATMHTLQQQLRL